MNSQGNLIAGVIIHWLIRWVGHHQPTRMSDYSTVIIQPSSINQLAWLIIRVIDYSAMIRQWLFNQCNWLLEWIINWWVDWLITNNQCGPINNCRIINHASWLIKQSVSNRCWIINHANNQSWELVDWNRLTTNE